MACLDEEEYEALHASPDTGVNTLTGEGLAEVLDDAPVLIDVSNSPSFEDEAVMDFFTTSTTNLLAAAAEAGVRHYVALSVVGADRVPDSGYLRAKVAQEKLIDGASIPYTIVRATQFFEFVKRIADAATDGGVVRLPHVLFQPMAADDVAAAVCEVTQRAPADGIVEIGGPEQFRFDDFIRDGLAAMGDDRTVVADPKARYFGAVLQERSLVPDNAVRRRPVELVTARFVETEAKSGRPRVGWTEIGPKRCFFGPIPAEMAGNWPKTRASGRASTAAKPQQTSQTQDQRTPGSHPGGRRFESG